MQFFDFVVGFVTMIFVNMLHSAVPDFNIVMMPNLLPIPLNFSRILSAYGNIEVLLGFSPYM